MGYIPRICRGWDYNGIEVRGILVFIFLRFFVVLGKQLRLIFRIEFEEFLPISLFYLPLKGSYPRFKNLSLLIAVAIIYDSKYKFPNFCGASHKALSRGSSSSVRAPGVRPGEEHPDKKADAPKTEVPNNAAVS
jgi:hypothetical protein